MPVVQTTPFWTLANLQVCVLLVYTKYRGGVLDLMLLRRDALYNEGESDVFAVSCDKYPFNSKLEVLYL
jgi:hypothetical protein